MQSNYALKPDATEELTVNIFAGDNGGPRSAPNRHQQKSFSAFVRGEGGLTNLKNFLIHFLTKPGMKLIFFK